MINKYTISERADQSVRPASQGTIFAYFRIFVMLLLVSGCANFNLIQSPAKNVKPLRLYNPSQSDLHPDFVVYHNSPDESTLYFRLFINEILFNQANPETIDQGRIKIQYKLFSSYSEQIQDQNGVQEYIINKDDLEDHYLGTLKIATEEGKSYLLEIELTDINRQEKVRRLILLDRFNPKSQQNFLILSYPGNLIAFEKFFYSDETFRIVTANTQGKEIRIAYFKLNKVLPRPPYSTIEIQESVREADSVWTIPVNQQSLFRVENEGVYLFYPDVSKPNGVFVTNFGTEYPQINSPENMLPPIQYITTSDEYRKIISEPDLKKAVDEFWLDKGKGFDVARELIRAYYNRVVFANLYFTTDRPGWKTDRGMIYLLMGPPDFINKSETSETWIYKVGSTNQRYNFEFYLASDAIKGYEFVLNRSENHRAAWNTAVRSWRQGRIFSL